MTFAQRISLVWRRFSPLEERLLAEVREVLPSAAVATFDAQVAAITLVQRHPNWNVIAFYRCRFGKVDWSKIPMFPRMSEFPLAQVRFSIEGRRYKVTLTSVHGHIFDFSISPSPKRIAFSGWDTNPVKCLLSDPLDAGAKKPPLPIPPLWSEFITQPNSANSGWELYDADTARPVTLDEGEFIILAERDGDECILHRIEPPFDRLFYLESHDATPEPLNQPIADVLRESKIP